METKKTVWQVLSQIDCNKHTEKKNGLTYLSWAWAWSIVKEKYPTANYEVVKFDGKPYLADNDLGYLIQTNVTIDGETIGMQLPVMDGANKAQKSIDYSYKTKFGEKSVNAATMFDVNTAIMRCLTKNLAMFGLGMYIYAGEDLPQESEEVKAEKIKVSEDAKAKLMIIAVEEMGKATTKDKINAVWAKYPTLQIKDTDFYNATIEQGKKIKQ